MVLSFALMVLAFSRLPGRITGTLLRKLGGFSALADEIGRRQLLIALVCKVCGVLITAFEIGVIFYIMDIQAGLGEMQPMSPQFGPLQVVNHFAA